MQSAAADHSNVNLSDSSAGDPVAMLHSAFSAAIAEVLGPDFADADPVIRVSQNPDFGDYQANAAMALAREVNRKPRELAEAIAKAVADRISAIAEQPNVAGPGFINIRLKNATLDALLAAMDDDALGVQPDTDTHNVVIDLCGVNVAKQTHVGHLRSTIIGDCLARVFERLGRTVYRENHLGDWGLPIALVLYELRKAGIDLDRIEIADLDRAYRDAQLSIKGDMRGLAAAIETGAGPHRIIELEEQNASAQEALEGAKATLVRLQSGDPEVTRDWQRLIDCTMAAVYEVLDMLNVPLGAEHNRGESTYRDKLTGVVDAFVRAGLGVEDEHAIVVRFDDRERPLLIRKSDGGFLYATTDLAAVRHRVQDLLADRVIYVVDARQRDHFRDVFEAAHLIGWDKLPDGTCAQLIHLPFGAVLGEDKRPLRTRSGENVTLRSLLEAAIERGAREVMARAIDPTAPTHELMEEELGAIGKAVGIAAVKYADLSNELVRDYVFNMDRMVSFEGDTGPYLQYAHARICSIFRKADMEPDNARAHSFRIEQASEKQLALMLLRYGKVVADTAASLEPHRLCQYLYGLANAYSTFYRACPVLKAESDDASRSRLRLCNLVRRMLADGLNLLGIEAPQRM